MLETSREMRDRFSFLNLTLRASYMYMHIKVVSHHTTLDPVTGLPSETPYAPKFAFQLSM